MAIRTNGPVVEGTVRNLIEGVRSSPLPNEAVASVLEQVSRFTDQLVDTYCENIAPGEVGVGGTGRATADQILASHPPRALLYGRVQSGKTVSMILTTALCLDNGFRVIVVLTTDNVALVKQTAARFKDLDGPRVFAAIKDRGASYEWQGQEEDLRETISEDGLILVCSKNCFRLPEVIHLLQQINAADYPLLVLDDEADAATPDTTLAARSSEVDNAPAYASKINRLVTGNNHPEEYGVSLSEQLPHSLYVQITATPYVLLLQRGNDGLRPTNTFLLNPGEGYCGGEVFFSDFNVDNNSNHQGNLVLVGAHESATMRRGTPAGLAASINFFILSACALAHSKNNSWPRDGYMHLSHTSYRVADHELVASYIRDHLSSIRRRMRGNLEALREYFRESYLELNRLLDECPDIDTIIAIARPIIRSNPEVIIINSEKGLPDYSPRMNFIVGGNILGRGLTIDNLLVTYYIREARMSQMDTVWQHARMFGYRRSYLDYIRIYLPRQLAARFQQIHESEESLRQQLSDDAISDPVIIRVPNASRPTRPNALEAGAIRSFGANRDQIFPYYLGIDEIKSRQVKDILIRNHVPTEAAIEMRPTTIPLAEAQLLIDTVAIAEDDGGLWDADTILALIANYSSEFNGEMFVYVRELTTAPPDHGWIRGRLNGNEISLMRERSPRTPSLALLYYGELDQPSAWYPTLIMPKGSPSFVFSRA